MTEEDWFNFVSSGEPNTISVTRLPLELCRIIGCSSSLVRMTHDYALKCTYKHRLRHYHFPMLPIMIDVGRVISDRERHLSFYFYEDVVFGGWFTATIKANQAGNELWVATFHIASAVEANRMAKKHKIIREQKL